MEEAIKTTEYQVRDDLTPERLQAMYVTMLKIREAEERLSDLITAGEVKCPCHLYSGEEAIAVGVCFALRSDDMIFGSHRSHGHYLAKGGSLKAMFAEIFGKETGCSRGRGGSMHLFDSTVGMLGAAPIVSGTVPLALGAALASKIKRNDRVTVSFFGDGATGEGILFESLNFAALKKLPIIFVCENNLYSTHLPVREIRPSLPIYELAKPFGIKTSQVDGNDVLKIYECAHQAVERCRNGKGPVFIEFLTYRLRGHVGPDDNIQGAHTDIRPKQEIDEWKKKDPLIRFERYLRENDIISAEQLADAKRTVTEEVSDAYSFALNSSYPAKEDLWKHVFK